jgi:signal transduction histidine kinase
VNENITKDGRIITCEWHNRPGFDRDGNYVGFTALASDVTDRVAMESALRDTSARLKVLSRRIVDVQEAERRHLARELHDEIGQVLGAIAINLHAIRAVAGEAAQSRIDACVAEINTTIGQVRELALELRPVMLDTLGLASTLRWLVNHVIVNAGIIAHVDIVPDGEPPPGELATACFRVAQEALTNVTRHSKATQVWVSMSQEDSRSVTVAVRDDGVGV